MQHFLPTYIRTLVLPKIISPSARKKISFVFFMLQSFFHLEHRRRAESMLMNRRKHTCGKRIHTWLLLGKKKNTQGTKKRLWLVRNSFHVRRQKLLNMTAIKPVLFFGKNRSLHCYTNVIVVFIIISVRELTALLLLLCFFYALRASRK